MGQEAAGEGGAFIAPVPALVLISAQLLARLVAGRGHSLDNLVRVGLAAGHRDQGALGQGRGRGTKQASHSRGTTTATAAYSNTKQ